MKQQLIETISTQPIAAPRSVRKDNRRVVTSGRAGKILPLAFFPLLREDAINGTFNVRIEMAETHEMLMNAINVNVMAHFVPFLAFEKFSGLDEFNASYSGKSLKDGGAVVPFFEHMFPNWDEEILQTLGIHLRDGLGIRTNDAVYRGYNCLVNHRRKSRSTKLELRSELDSTLANAFWHHSTFSHIVPDFDQAAIEGEVPLTINGSSTLPIQGLIRKVDASTETTTQVQGLEDWNMITSQSGAGTGFDTAGIFAELDAQNVTISLANIDAAKKTAAFARMRERYNGLDDESLIDMLMDGIRIPAEELSQPVLLARQSAIIGYTRRYATDSGNLDQSVTAGETFTSLRIRTPAMNTGGIVYLTAEIVPEQMFERQSDPFLDSFEVDDLPNFTRDFLDPEKVDRVYNAHVDVDHNDPEGTFGWAPLNHRWNRDIVTVGGKYYRSKADSPDNELRQKFWATEIIDPELTEDFYVCPDELPHNVFLDTESDPFEITARCEVAISGRTVFGKGLIEDNDNYNKVASEVDYDRQDQENSHV